jgi:hypothetical protein
MMGYRTRGALVAALLAIGAMTLAGCKTHSEAIANPCPSASDNGAPQEPKVGLTPDELKAAGECSSSTTTSDTVCADVDTLKTSVTDLKNVDVVGNGASDLQDAVNKVKDNAETVRADSASALRSAVDQFETALTAVRTSLQNVVSEGTAPVKTAVQNARQSAHDLQDQAKSLYDCE